MEIKVANIKVTRQCIDCGHIQEVESAASVILGSGETARYFGSAYDFCNKCDGPLKTISAELPKEPVVVPTKTYKTNQLTGLPLRYAVAKAEYTDGRWFGCAYGHTICVETAPGSGFQFPFRPDEDASQAWVIIDRENICFDVLPDNGHRAFQREKNGRQINFMDCWFSTKLETAMRCFVASKFGDEVEIPEDFGAKE